MFRRISIAVAPFVTALALIPATAQAGCTGSGPEPGAESHCYGNSLTYLHKANAELWSATARNFYPRGSSLYAENAISNGQWWMGTSATQGAAWVTTRFTSRISDTNVTTVVDVVDLVKHLYVRYRVNVCGTDDKLVNGYGQDNVHWCTTEPYNAFPTKVGGPWGY